MKKTNTTETKNTEIKKPNLNGKILSGVVTSNKMKDTIVVSVGRYIKVPKYNKYITINKKFKAHDAGNVCKIGDKVSIQECRPISKDKHFTVLRNNK